MSGNKNTIGMIPSISIIVGSVLGTGVFFAPSMVAKFSTHIGVVAGLWMLGALLCVIGADIYGRLGQVLPSGGGQYIYLQKGINESTALIYGWLSLFVLCPTMIAGMCLFLGSQATYVFPDASPFLVKILAGGTAAFLTVLNFKGIKAAGKFQSSIVIVQILMIIGMAVALFLSNAQPAFEVQSSTVIETSGTLGAAVLAFAAILWSFEGFNSLTFITDEISDGKKKVRFLLFLGTTVVVVIYIVLNFCAVYFISPSEIAHTSNIAVRLNEIGFGAIGKNLTLILTVVGLVTTGHAAILIGPRITEKLSQDGYLPRVFSRLHRKNTSPNHALALQLALVLLYIGVGSFEALIIGFVVVNWAFYMLVALSLFRILPKEQLTWVVKAEIGIFSTLVLGFIGAQTYQNPAMALAGVAVLAGSILLARHFLEKKHKMQPQELALASSSVMRK